MGNIVEKSVKDQTAKVWDVVPVMQEKSWLNFDLGTYNKSFVNLAVAVGAIAVAGSVVKLAHGGLKTISACKKVPTTAFLKEKYGPHSWAMIAECKNN